MKSGCSPILDRSPNTHCVPLRLIKPSPRLVGGVTRHMLLWRCIPPSLGMARVSRTDCLIIAGTMQPLLYERHRR